MQMAGLSPESTQPAASSFSSAVPYFMTAEMAPMLASTTMRAVTPQALAISSTTRTVSRKPRPWPPCSRGTVIPMKPASRSASTLSQG